MKTIQTKAELWKQTDEIRHTCRCARVCYQSEPKSADADARLYERLQKDGHSSVFRHASRYFIIPTDKRPGLVDTLVLSAKTCPYYECKFDDTAENLYLSTNAQFIMDHTDIFEAMKDYEVLPDGFNETETGHSIMRWTICVTTGIDMTREFNRVSPNSISEESTRYCRYGCDRFGYIGISESDAYNIKDITPESVKSVITCVALDQDKDDGFPLMSNEIFAAAFRFAEIAYMKLLEEGLAPEMARKVLPLATKSQAVYTYSVSEWSHILQHRLLDKTGKAHPDAHTLAHLIYMELRKVGYALDSNGNLF